MQKWFAKLVSILMLAWTSTSFANLPSANANLEDDIQKIASWKEYLNYQYPTLDLEIVVQLDQERNSRAVLREINQLKDVLSGARSFPAKTFRAIACTRVECG